MQENKRIPFISVHSVVPTRCPKLNNPEDSGLANVSILVHFEIWYIMSKKILSSFGLMQWNVLNEHKIITCIEMAIFWQQGRFA